jgi:hypothetical protein
MAKCKYLLRIFVLIYDWHVITHLQNVLTLIFVFLKVILLDIVL